MNDRGYLPLNMPMMKRVLALPGQTVCRHGRDIMAYGAFVGSARERDNAGRQMPIWQGCRRIADDEVFLMNADVADSVDSRYFGPFRQHAIIGRARPIWTDEAGDSHFQWRATTR